MASKESLHGAVRVLGWPSLRSDNNAASACLIKGYSPKVDFSELVGVYWLAAASYKVSIYIDRVESKSNLSDGPSRFDHELLFRLGSGRVTPRIPQTLLLSNISKLFS